MRILILLLLVGSAQACTQAYDDPAGDYQTAVLDPAIDASPADILHQNLTWGELGLEMSVTLGGDPRGRDPLTFSYWFSFEDGDRSSGGNSPTWTFQRDSQFQVIRTMYWDTDDLPVTWNGTTVSFTIPWEHVQQQYGNNTGEIGNPRASSSGPYATASGSNNPSQDFGQYASSFEALVCPDLSDGAGNPVAPVQNDTSNQNAPVDSGDAGPQSTNAGKDSPAPFALLAILLALLRRPNSL